MERALRKSILTIRTIRTKAEALHVIHTERTGTGHRGSLDFLAPLRFDGALIIEPVELFGPLWQ